MSYKKYKKPRESDIKLPRATFCTSQVPKDRCYRLSVHECRYEHQCCLCDCIPNIKLSIGDDPPPYPVIDHLSCFADKAKIKYNYYKKVVAVKPETLLKLGKKELLYFQFFMCTDGPGCLPNNDLLEVDGYFLSDPGKTITLKRMDIIGIPMLHACKEYDRHFFTNTVRDCGYLQGGGA